MELMLRAMLDFFVVVVLGVVISMFSLWCRAGNGAASHAKITSQKLLRKYLLFLDIKK